MVCSEMNLHFDQKNQTKIEVSNPILIKTTTNEILKKNDINFNINHFYSYILLDKSNIY